MDVTITRADAGPLLVAWARAQLEGGIGEGLVCFCVMLAIGDLLVDGQAELPDLRGFL